jgi:hypothetical protein
MKIKLILIAASLFGISFAQNSTGLTFTEYLRQIQNADSLPKIDTHQNRHIFQRGHSTQLGGNAKEKCRYRTIQGTHKYADKYKAAQKSQDEANMSASLRNEFFISAGVFGLAGAVSFFF